MQDRIAHLLAQMTLEEKVALCSGQDFWHLKGIERLGIPAIMVADGPHGLRKQTTSEQFALIGNVPATCFPTASALASSWSRELLRAVGTALGEEARAEGVSVLLGPGVNIKRSPMGGRNFEYFSEDPFLSGALATAYIEGVQATGVGTSIKHFAANNQEFRRFSIDAIVDERALREIYLASFEQPIKAAKPWTVMAAYNRLNGVYCTEHQELLTAILREEWGFDGVVLSDWGAVSTRPAGLAAGLDLEMPGVRGAHDGAILAAVREGRLPEAALDRAVARILTLIEKASGTRRIPCDLEAHHDLARRAAAEGAVLLKNDRQTLPLHPGQTIAVIGAFAKAPRYQGAGSSVITPTRLENAYEAIAQRIPADRLRYAPGFDPDQERPDPKLIAEAVRTAQGADVVLLFAGLPAAHETEGLDRPHMQLPPSQNALIAAVAAANPNVVVILSNGAPVEMPWHDRVPAILEGYLGGQAGGSAIAQLLFGEVNPSGKLAETFPHRLEDHPTHACFPGGPRTVEYRESLCVGYRYYDTAGKEVLFPFGHGLSYTSFAYSDLRIGGQELDLTVSVTITNTGERTGQEVVQLYVRELEAAVFRPAQELKGFEKIALQPGEAGAVTFTLDRRAFAYWDTDLHDWQAAPGAFEIRVGASSRDIRATATVTIGTAAPGRRPPVAAPDFAAVYGRPLPANTPDQRGSFTLDTPLGDMRASMAARLLLAGGKRQAKSAIKDDADSPTARAMERIIEELPLRALLMGTGGKLTLPMLEGLLLVMNGRRLAGVGQLLRALLTRR